MVESTNTDPSKVFVTESRYSCGTGNQYLCAHSRQPIGNKYPVDLALLERCRRALCDERAVDDWDEDERPKEPICGDVLVRSFEDGGVCFPKTGQRVRTFGATVLRSTSLLS